MRSLFLLVALAIIGSNYSYASGTFIAWPPKPKLKMDCSSSENKTKPECKK